MKDNETKTLETATAAVDLGTCIIAAMVGDSITLANSSDVTELMASAINVKLDTLKTGVI